MVEPPGEVAATSTLKLTESLSKIESIIIYEYLVHWNVYVKGRTTYIFSFSSIHLFYKSSQYIHETSMEAVNIE